MPQLLGVRAYTLAINLRQLARLCTQLRQACTATIRSRLLKRAAVVLREDWRVSLTLASPCPLRDVFEMVAKRLAASL